MNDIRFGGTRPTHLIETAEDATDQQVDQVVRQILDGNGPPLVLPKGWSIHPIEYRGPRTGIDTSMPPVGAFLLVALAAFIMGIVVAALGFGVALGGII